jgi:hypothetical protein
MNEGQASDGTGADSQQPRVPAVRLGTKWTDWKHKRRGVPAGELDEVPDGATTWTCLERVNDMGVPTTLTIYRTPSDGAVVLVTVDDEREEVREFGDVDAAAADTQDLMAEYGPSE